MAYIVLDTKKLKHNFLFLNNLFSNNDKEWAVVSKLFCGNRGYLEYLISLGPNQICDSRISNLEIIKDIDPEMKTIYIKPPAHDVIEEVVRYADTSFNSELETIRLLSEEALKQDKIHKVIIMIELGDLREGIMGEDLIAFYGEVFELKGIEVTGIGANLNCLSGVLPSQDKLIQLSLYEQLIEANFHRQIPWVSGGTSITIPLIERGQVPKGVNHFRVGETLYFGNHLLDESPYEGMQQGVIKLYAQIIEMADKPKIPIGLLAESPSGHTVDIDEADYGETAYRAIIDIGLLDISPEYLIPEDPKVSVIGASSDMIILDLSDREDQYNVGDMVAFRMKYMGALGVFNSDYIEKRLI
ncbi:alanine racemase [Halosquirtibacter xylanolyticus]|uniref:alanine racemase n=1 Tax=Halosquirtibacter xylanolyticus TaxID=3374599 RepID=UPI0037490036|nr:alanine racemase [Prolixibacteraceae bacterium]